MKATPVNFSNSQALPLVAGALIAWIVWATLTGRTLPFISGPRPALLVMLVLGLAMCSHGIGQVAASGRWASPAAILGYLLGAAILLVVLAAFTGWKLPLIHSDTQSVAAVAGLILVKVLIDAAGGLFHWL